jgi:hypothetical protein
MLAYLSETARKYRMCAATARALAGAATDPDAKKDYLEIAWRCLDRAQSYEFSEWMRRVSTAKHTPARFDKSQICGTPQEQKLSPGSI